MENIRKMEGKEPAHGPKPFLALNEMVILNWEKRAKAVKKAVAEK